jgi:hypothetical protein
MSRQIALFLLALVGWASAVRAASPDEGAEGGATKKIGVLAVETHAVAPQLAKRLHGTVFEALRAEGLQPHDLTDSHGYLAECHSPTECLATLRKRQLDYVLFAKLAPSPASAPGKPEHEITVRLGRIPRGVSVWGPWPMSTTCSDCSDSELADTTRGLVASAWKAMRLAQLPPEEIEIATSDRRDRGRKLLKQAADEQLPVFNQIHLLKQAIRAGASGQAFAQLAQLFFAYGGYEEAEDYAAQAATQGEKTDVVRGPSLWFTGRWAEAQAVFQRLVRDFPGDRHWQKALAEVDLRVRDGRSVLEQAEVELKHGDPAKAALLARIALASGRGTRAHLALAKASLATSSYADALAQFLAVLDDDPGHAEALSGKLKAEAALRQSHEARARRF